MQTLGILILVIVSASLGGMLFFASVVAPTVFRVLDQDQAGTLIRALFPIYYRVFAVATGVAALIGVPLSLPLALVLALVSGGFTYAGASLMPRINALRDSAKQGDAAAQQAFDRLHRWSVRLNGIQFVVLGGCLFWLIQL